MHDNIKMISPHALTLAQTLIRMNTVSRNSNLVLIHFIRDELSRLGVKSRLTWNADKTKANLFATLGEGKPAGVILSGHTDTVPWDGQDWRVDPLGAIISLGSAAAHAYKMSMQKGDTKKAQQSWEIFLASMFSMIADRSGFRGLLDFLTAAQGGVVNRYARMPAYAPEAKVEDVR